MTPFVLTHVTSKVCRYFWCQSTREENLISGNQNIYNDNRPEFYSIGKFYFHLDLLLGVRKSRWLTERNLDELEDILDWREKWPLPHEDRPGAR